MPVANTPILFYGIRDMAEAGITDFRATLQLPTERQACTDFLSPIVEGFRKVTG